MATIVFDSGETCKSSTLERILWAALKQLKAELELDDVDHAISNTYENRENITAMDIAIDLLEQASDLEGKYNLILERHAEITERHGEPRDTKAEEIMSVQQVIDVLTQYNLWRRDNNNPSVYQMPQPRDIGLAIDAAIYTLSAFQKGSSDD